ncbi:MAG: sulfatase-like hydrolase/transferase [Bryobacterales bacterium]
MVWLAPSETLQTPPYLPTDFDDIPALAQKLAAVPMMPTADWALRNGEWRNIVQGYLASVSFADHYVGQVLAALDASPYADNTIVVLWGDHGYHIGEKNRFAKHSLWEEATHTPLIVSAPGYGRGRRTARAAQLIDIYPTLVGTLWPAAQRAERRAQPASAARRSASGLAARRAHHLRLRQPFRTRRALPLHRLRGRLGRALRPRQRPERVAQLAAEPLADRDDQAPTRLSAQARRPGRPPRPTTTTTI